MFLEPKKDCWWNFVVVVVVNLKQTWLQVFWDLRSKDTKQNNKNKKIIFSYIIIGQCYFEKGVYTKNVCMFCVVWLKSFFLTFCLFGPGETLILNLCAIFCLLFRISWECPLTRTASSRKSLISVSLRWTFEGVICNNH